MTHLAYPNESAEYRNARNDSVSGGARHVGQRASLYIVAKSPIARLIAWARERRWDHLQFLSTAGNRYDADYFGDSSKVPGDIRKRRDPKGGPDWDETMFNVFRLDSGKVRHCWRSELTRRRKILVNTIDPAMPWPRCGDCST